MTKKSLLILEIVWIVIAISSVIAGIHYAINTGGKRIFVFIIMTMIALLMAWLRHYQRKKAKFKL
jgi:uncharacterized membrane protein